MQAFKGSRAGHRAFDNSNSKLMQRMKREMQNELKFIPDRLSDPLLDLGEFVPADIGFDVRIKHEHAFDAEFQVKDALCIADGECITLQWLS